MDMIEKERGSNKESIHKKDISCIWDATRIKKMEYMGMLDQLRKNEEHVPSELLRTRYRKGYDELRDRLIKSTYLIMQDIVFYGLLIRKENAAKVYAEINRLTKESGILNEISRAIFRDKDLNLIEECIARLREQVHGVAKRWLAE